MLSVTALLQMASTEKRPKPQPDTSEVRSEPFDPLESLHNQQGSGDHDIPTLEEIAFLSAAQAGLLAEETPTAQELKQAENNLAMAGFTQEQLDQISAQVRKQILKEISASLQTAMGKAVARTVATATRDVRKHIQKQIESALPELIDQAIARSKDKI